MIYKQPKEATTGLTYTRSGAATAWRADGTLAEFAPNVIRRTDAGVLIEGQRTNLYLRWDPTIEHITTKGGNVSNAQPPANAPLTGRNWVELGAGGSSGPTYMYPPCSAIASSSTVTFSCLCETPDGTPPVYGPGVTGSDFDVGFDRGGALTGASFSTTRRSGNIWDCRLTGVTPASGTSVYAGVRRTSVIQNQRPLKFSGFQLEQAPDASSPIITTGAAATRGADDFYIGGLQQLFASPYSFVVECEALPTNGVRSLAAVNSGGTTNRVLIYRGTGVATFQLQVRAGGSTVLQQGSSPMPGSERAKAALSFDGRYYRACVNGVMFGGGEPTATFTVPPDRIHPFGSATSAEQSYAAGRRLVILPYSLTDEELVKLTSLNDTTFDHLNPGGVYYYDAGQTAMPRKSQVVAPISLGNQVVVPISSGRELIL